MGAGAGGRVGRWPWGPVAVGTGGRGDRWPWGPVAVGASEASAETVAPTFHHTRRERSERRDGSAHFSPHEARAKRAPQAPICFSRA
jgi:hypothetical protein